MNADRLLSHFERISDAPDAVDRLRRFILDLAVRGKLVQQDQAESAESSEAPTADEPFPLPSNWSCVALGGILQMINGRAFKPSEWLSKGLPIVRIQNLNNKSAPFNCCDPQGVDEKNIINTGTFLISWSGTPGTSFGAFIWQRGKAALNQHIFKCLPTGTEYLDRFLQLAINGRLDEMIAKAHGGVGLQHITKGKLEALALPLPPLAEQYRIVAKVDELMQLCDRLESSQKEREGRWDRLVTASLNRLAQPTDPDEFKKDAGFHLSNLNRLSTKPEHVKELRKAILNLAVRGKLVPQDGREGIAEAYATEPQHPALPKAWKVLTFGRHCDIEGGGQPPKTVFSDKPRPGYVRLYQIRDLGDKPVPTYIPEKVARSRCREGDILIGRYGASVGKIFWARDGAYNVAMAKFIYPPDAFVPAFAFLLLRSSWFQTALANAARSAQAGFNKGDLKDITFPLPPLAEQKRIVAKVDQLMLICDQLESQLDSQQKGRRQLLEALLHEALEGVG